MAYRVPIFPLKLVLFPGAPQMLHVFELRYRKMLEYCLQQDNRFAIVLASDAHETPPEGSIGCTALIRTVQRLADGRSNILVTGEERCRLDSYVVSDEPYLLADVSEYEDDTDPVPLDVAQLETLNALFRRYVGLERELNDTAGGTIELPEEPGELTFQVAASLDIDPRTKQELLESRSVRERIDSLVQRLPDIIARLEERMVIHRRARRNGHGPA